MLIEIIIPVYNEEQILEKNVLKLMSFCQKANFGFDWIITIADNKSTDKTAEISKTFSQKFPNIIFYKTILERGKGIAIKETIMNSKADIAIYMDSDLAVPLKYLNEAVAPILKNDYDLILGSRLLPDSKTSRSLKREISSRIYNFISKIALSHNFHDLQCGFKAIKVEKFKEIAEQITNKKFFFDTEMIMIAKKNNFRIKEIPIEWFENMYEKRKSKVNFPGVALSFVYELSALRKRLNK